LPFSERLKLADDSPDVRVSDLTHFPVIQKMKNLTEMVLKHIRFTLGRPHFDPTQVPKPTDLEVLFLHFKINYEKIR